MCQYPVFETIAIIDGNIQQLYYHQVRMDYTCKYYFQSENSLVLADIINIPEEFRKGVVRCRIEYTPTDYQIYFFAYQKRDVSRFQCVYTQDLDYSFKFCDRKRLENLKNLQSDEIIIVNNGFVSDCSIGNLLFLKKGKWYSPRHYLLKGTQLMQLIERNQVELIDFPVETLFDYEKIMLINALNPFDLQRAIPISYKTILL